MWVLYLKFPRDFAEARQGEDAPYSVQACEQSPCASWHDGMGFVGWKDAAVIL